MKLKPTNTLVYFIFIILLEFITSQEQLNTIIPLQSKLPSPRYGSKAVYDGNDYIYVLGGYEKTNVNGYYQDYTSEILRFTISTEVIEIIGNLPEPVCEGTAIYDNEESCIIYFGGHNGTSSLKILKISISPDGEINDESFAYIGNLPSYSIRTSSSWDGLDSVYIQPGEGFNQVMMFSISTHQVSSLPGNLSIVRSPSVWDQSRRNLLLLGGFDYGNGYVGDIFQYNSTSNPAQTMILEGKLRLTRHTPNAFWNGNNFVFLFGGSSYSNGTVVYNIESNCVNVIPLDGFPQNLHGDSAVFVESKNRIYSFGGTQPIEGKNYRDEIFYIDLNNVEVPDCPKIKNGISLVIWTSLAAGGIVVLFITYVGVNLYRQRVARSYKLTNIEYKRFMKGYSSNVEKLSKDVDNGLHDGYESAQKLPYLKKFEIPSNELEIDTTNPLGSGAFGIVFKGIFTTKQNIAGVTVAVKTLKENAGKVELQMLLSELKVMMYVGTHDNVISFIGAQTKYLRKGRVFIVVEYCELGSLENYLRSGATLIQASNEMPGYVIVDNYTTRTPQITSQLQWCYQIACGMEFISSKNLIHGDLATRNVLLSKGLVAKITDFGLSQKIYDQYKKYITMSDETALPWRWLAIEALSEFKFSTASDVWSFGIVLWEIFSLAQLPYPAFTWNDDFISMLEDGYRLPNPCEKSCSSEVYNLMTHCWNKEASKRPSFNYLSETLNELISNEKQLPKK